MSGVVILDTNCYKQLRDPERQDRLQHSLRSADLQIWPTVINVLEVTKHPTSDVRRTLLNTIRAFSADRPLLPWPLEILRDVGLAITRQQSRFVIRQSRIARVLQNPALADRWARQATLAATRIEEQFTTMHEDARSVLQPFLKANGLRNNWETAALFLKTEWTKPDVIAHFAELVWRGLKLPDPPLIDQVLQNEVWKLFLEMEGLAVYYRAVVTDMPSRTHRLDLLQLPYMSAGQPRIFVTNETALFDAARALLTGRYVNSRVVRLKDLLDT